MSAARSIARSRRARALHVFVFVAGVGACARDRSAGRVAPAVDAEARAPASAELPPAPPTTGMVWVAGGALVAGTSPDRVPRVADAEMRGEQVVLHGFWIDEYAYPNEAGAIPKTGASRDEAATLCEEQGKRLCSELEWERACKGPLGSTYEYGEIYRPAECGTGVAVRLAPSGLRAPCKSAFGVHDMHGGPFEWTSSPFGRGTRGLATVRGGNSEAGELVARCANAEGRAPGTRVKEIGFRCCAGEPNGAEVAVVVTRGKPFEPRALEAKLARALEGEMGAQVAAASGRADVPALDRAWTWRPVGNEELVVAGGCARAGGPPSCGVVVARVGLGEIRVLSFVPSGLWEPNVEIDHDPRELWVFGGDFYGAFRRRATYEWASVRVGAIEHKVEPGTPKAGATRY